MKNILKNKLFIILSFFMFLICIINTNSLASDTIEFHNHEIGLDITMEVREEFLEYDYYMILPYSKNYDLRWDAYAVLCSNNPLRHIGSEGNTFYYKGDLKWYKIETKNKNQAVVDVSNSTITLYKTLNSEDYTFFTGGPSNGILQANHTVYAEDGETVVFQVAPPEIVEPEIPEQEKTQLTQIVEQMEPKKVMAEVIIILPMILITIVGLIGLRKALEFLQKLLRKS